MDERHAALMDRTYRRMKHVYDATRPLFLFGRPALRRRIANANHTRILEVGSGTGRNLILLARALPGARLTGLDISAEMTGYARARVCRAGLAGRIALHRTELADHLATGPQPAQAVLFSYSLSMIPDWQGALRLAAKHLRATGGRLYIVDFGGMEAWPGPLRRQVARNLGAFHVTPRTDLPEFLATDPAFAGAETRLTLQFGGCAMLAETRLPTG